VSVPAARAWRVFLVAGEHSGDQLGFELMRALREATDGAIAFSGIGGAAMEAEGLQSLFPLTDIAVMGILPVIGRLPTLLARIRETAAAIVAAPPDAMVIIDSPDFTHRVARRVRARAPAIPILDYVSPSVWAWRQGRARAMRAYVDCVLAILPFEPAAHAQLGGPPCIYVGHPLLERISELRPNADEARRRRADPPLVLVLPGSRSSEIRRLLGIFGAAIAHVADRIGPLEPVLPTVPHLAAEVRAGVAEWAVIPRVVVEPAEKWGAFRSARAALAASGTVTLELALAGIPTVAAYRLALVEEAVARLIRLRSRLPSVILANLVVGENVVPELLQWDCTPQRLADALMPLLSETPERLRQIEGFERLDHIMALEMAPSAKAAGIVLDIARRGRREVTAAAARES
jgi:lipid-A-disaccharide synthase